MNVNQYSSLIREEIDRNSRLTADQKRTLQHVFGASLKAKPLMGNDTAALARYSNHHNVENVRRSYRMFHQRLDQEKDLEKRVSNKFRDMNWSFPRPSACEIGQTYPVPPTDKTYSTLDDHNMLRAIIQRDLACSMLDPDIMSDVVGDMGGFKAIGTGSYGAGFQVRRFHDIDNKGLLLKLVYNIERDSHRYSLEHEYMASLQINELIPLSQNLVYTYGHSNNFPSCRRLLNQIDDKDRKILSKDVCAGYGKSNFILSEFVQDSTPMRQYFKTAIPKLKTAEDVHDMLGVFMQLLGTFSYLANVKRMAHNDAHSDNIMIQTLSKPVELTYYLPNGRKFIVETKTVAKLIDYGFVSMTNTEGYYLKHPYLILPETFMPAADIYEVIHEFMYYLTYYGGHDKSPAVNLLLNVFSNLAIYGIYRRRGVDNDVSKSLIQLLTTFKEGPGRWYHTTVLPNWGGYSNVDNQTPEMYDFMVKFINDAITKDQYNEHFRILKGTSAIMPHGFKYIQMNKRDFKFLESYLDTWNTYSRYMHNLEDTKDNRAYQEFMQMYRSPAFAKAFDDIVENKDMSRHVFVYTKLLHPMAILRIDTLGMGTAEYRNAVSDFEHILTSLYNLLEPSDAASKKMKQQIESYFYIAGIIINNGHKSTMISEVKR